MITDTRPGFRGTPNLVGFNGASEEDGYDLRGNHVAKDRRRWMALYSIVGWKMGLKMLDDEIMLLQCGKPCERKLREWAMEIEDGATPDPAIEKLMRQRVEEYKSLKHWQFINANADAGIKLANEIIEKGECKSPVTLSYLGNNVNYGMREGAHIQKQGPTQFQVNGGTVKIISNRVTAPSKMVPTKKAKRLMGPKPIDAEYRTVD